MKIAISSKGKGQNSEVSEISGRAKFYLIFEDGKLVKTIKNPFAIGGGGAGLAVAKMLENEKVDMVISGRFGDKMKHALNLAGVSFKEVDNKTVKKALEENAKTKEM